MVKQKVPTYQYIYNQRQSELSTHVYSMCHFGMWNYTVLDKIMYINIGGKIRTTINDVIIMADTETSKKPDSEHNHVVVWTISIRAFHLNIVTLYGRRPSEFCDCVNEIISHFHGQKTYIYFHNLSYDYVFLRKFLYKSWGYPVRELATKPHYPINIEFENGVCLRDSLILAQRKLEKWANDLQVEHQKSVGKWNYSKLRNQNTELDADELEYIEHDTLAGVECIDLTLQQLHKNIAQVPYTATGIPREQVRKLAKANRGRERFLSMCLSYDDYIFGTSVYHGGFTHANRNEIGWINPATCYDFCSSYPFVMLSQKYGMERFTYMGEMSVESIIELSEKYAFMFTLIIGQPKVKKDIVMPALQFSKCTTTINAIQDNGRIMYADYAQINITEQDLSVILEQYTWNFVECVNVRAARKDYLPRWFTDYVYQCFYDKTMLKGGDPVAYSIAKAKVNSLYGMCCQKSIQPDLIENYELGDFKPAEFDPIEKYEKYLQNRNSILPYQWGIWVTAYAFKNLFELGKCVAQDGIWLYSDTDSCYATKWNMEKINAYNEHCKKDLLANGYGAVVRDGKEYWLGVAELDGVYSEFISNGAKRYACRDAESGKLKITVAGVPKKDGVKCLKDDIHNFKDGMIFDGLTTGKLEHKYIFVDDIYIDGAGNETGDSVDLSPCDYTLDSINVVDWDLLENTEILMQVYE